VTAREQFRQCLSEFARVVDRLLECARRQKEAFLANDLAAIEATRREQEELLAGLERLRAPLAASWAALEIPAGGNPEAFLAGRPEWSGLWRELTAGLAQLREATRTNRLLAARAAAFYRRLGALLRPDRQAGTYAASGRLREAHAPVISRVV